MTLGRKSKTKKIDKFPNSWLFQQRPRKTIVKWVNNLRYFYFYRAWGGHSNDSDIFEASFLFKGREDLLLKMEAIGIRLNPSQESHSNTSKIFIFPDLEQPGRVTIAGEKMFVWVHETSFTITRIGAKNEYFIEEEDYIACINVEKFLDELNFMQYLDISVTENVSCISKFRYPELFR